MDRSICSKNSNDLYYYSVRDEDVHEYKGLVLLHRSVEMFEREQPSHYLDRVLAYFKRA
jgi:hypothetical protein